MGPSLSAWSSVLYISILIYVLVFSVHSEDYSLIMSILRQSFQFRWRFAVYDNAAVI